MALTYQRLTHLRRCCQDDPQLAQAVAAVRRLEQRGELRHSRTSPRGPVGLIAQEAQALGWDWSASPWEFRRPGSCSVPLCGGPNGYFQHAVRDGLRDMEMRKAAERRPNMQGAPDVDRRAVYAAFKWHSKEGRGATPYQQGCMRTVVTGAATLQKQLAGAGLVESACCPFCDSGEDEDEEHTFWRCPAWAHIREEELGARTVEVGHLPQIPRTCGLLTRTPEDKELPPSPE